MKTAPITVTEMAKIGVVLGAGFVMYTAYKAFSGVTFGSVVSGVGAAVSDVVSAGATAGAKAVDTRTPAQDPNELSLGGVQQAVANAVQRGQDAGATNFFSAYLTGLFK